MNDVNQGSINAASTRPGDSFSGQAVVGPAAPLRDLPQIDSSTQGQPAANPLSSDRVHPIRFAPLHKTAPPPALRILGETALILLVLVLTGAVSSLTPVGAIFLAFGASILLEVAGAGGPKKFWERFIFDISTIKWRFFREKPSEISPKELSSEESSSALYNVINIRKLPGETGRIILGAMPMQENSDFGDCFKKHSVCKVVTVQAEWEREDTWLKTSYTRDDYEKIGIENPQFSVKDHDYPSVGQLDDMANEIAQGLKKGSVYVHCKAGQGRSAMAVAAYLIRYRKMSAHDVCWTILGSRPTSTIAEKLKDQGSQQGLMSYAKLLKQDKRDVAWSFAKMQYDDPTQSSFQGVYLSDGQLGNGEEDV